MTHFKNDFNLSERSHTASKWRSWDLIQAGLSGFLYHPTLPFAVSALCFWFTVRRELLQFMLE